MRQQQYAVLFLCITLHHTNTPNSFTMQANVILFIAIFITVTFSLKSLNNEILQRTQTQDDKKLIRSVLFKTMAQFFKGEKEVTFI